MKNRLTVCILSLLFAMPLLAQTESEQIFDDIIASPQTWSFMKYGGSKPNLNTGTVSVNIPIYTYKDNDFTFPISLSYASNGYIPNVQANYVGLGWFLNAGGCITREVNGFPDDYNFNGRLGYFYYYNAQDTSILRRIPNIYDRGDNIFNKLPHSYFYRITGTTGIIETLQDVFHFNFCGHTGSFVLGLKQIHVFNSKKPAGEYTVDLSHFTGEDRTIKITTGNGTQYTFSNNGLESYGSIHQRKLEIQPSYKDQMYSESGISQRPTTWLLREIKAPNGRTLTIDYTSYYDDGRSMQEENVRPGGAYDNSTGNQASSGVLGCAIGDFIRRYPLEFYRLWSRQNTAQISKISIRGAMEINFAYNTSRKQERACYRYETQPLLTLPLLDSITVVSLWDNTILKNCKFEYEYSIAGRRHNNILFLKSLHLSNEGRYSMQYYDEDQMFPLQGTSSIDHWGYYNRDTTYNILDLRPALYISKDKSIEIITSTNRNPNFNFATKGILKKLSYPTGGYTTFEYENHTYSKYLTRYGTGDFLPSLLDEIPAKTTGGIRIRKITDYSSAGEKTSRKYHYNSNGLSSGILLNTPRYTYFEKISTVYGMRIIDIESFSQLPCYMMNTSHIEYTNVQETQSDGSRIEYQFTSYMTFPDVQNQSEKRKMSDKSLQCEPLLANNLYIQPDYMTSARGRVNATIYYDKNQRRKTHFASIYDTSKSLAYVESIAGALEEYYILRTTVESYPILRTEETEYGDSTNEKITTTKSYLYNKLGQTVSVRQTNSDGSIHCDSTVYVSDIPVNQRSNIHKGMIAAGVLESPIRIYKMIQKPGETTAKIVKTDTYAYLQVPSTTQFRLASVNSTGPKLSYEAPFDVSGLVAYYNLYDKGGRLLQMTDKNRVSTCYIWGHNGLYPVAKIVNATYAEVMACDADLANLLTAPISGKLPESLHTKLRNGLPNAEVTIYEHIPFIGLRKIIDPTGRGISYTYTNDKLTGIHDDVQGAWIKTFNYSIY